MLQSFFEVEAALIMLLTAIAEAPLLLPKSVES